LFFVLSSPLSCFILPFVLSLSSVICYLSCVLCLCRVFALLVFDSACLLFAFSFVLFFALILSCLCIVLFPSFLVTVTSQCASSSWHPMTVNDVETRQPWDTMALTLSVVLNKRSCSNRLCLLSPSLLSFYLAFLLSSYLHLSCSCLDLVLTCLSLSSLLSMAYI
jgi:hypothetical protein